MIRIHHALRLGQACSVAHAPLSRRNAGGRVVTTPAGLDRENVDRYYTTRLIDTNTVYTIYSCNIVYTLTITPNRTRIGTSSDDNYHLIYMLINYNGNTSVHTNNAPKHRQVIP